MALAWVLREGRVTSALIGASKPEQVVGCAGAIQNLESSTDKLQRINTYATDRDLKLWAASPELAKSKKPRIGLAKLMIDARFAAQKKMRHSRLDHHFKPGRQQKRTIWRICSEAFLPKFDFKTLHKLSPRCHRNTGNNLVTPNGDQVIKHIYRHTDMVGDDANDLSYIWFARSLG